MRGFEHRRNDASSRNAESLFESKSIVEIREVENVTRKEIQEKREELRQLVGASYRDLIDSADSILLMRNSCESIVRNLLAMEDGFDSLKQSISGAPVSQEMDREVKMREELYAIGSRVKYLVDTPEKIWGCLDEHMYLEGAERYLRAKEVHNVLNDSKQNGGKHDPMANFPLLRHQWPLVETFLGQISRRSRDRLQNMKLAVGEYAIALAAVAIVENLSSSQVFTLFLETRKTWLRNFLRTARAGKGQLESTGISAIFRGAVEIIQVTLCHIGELFLEVSNGKSPLLFSTILTAPPSSQLFGGVSNPEKEVKQWKADREMFESSMRSLSGEAIAEGSFSFLETSAEELSTEGGLLVEMVGSGKDLSEIENSIREDIEKQKVIEDSLQWLMSAFGQEIISTPWNFLSSLLLKKPIQLWDVLFEKIFMRRMKSIVDKQTAEIKITRMVDEYLSSIDSSSCFGQAPPRIGLLRSVYISRMKGGRSDEEEEEEEEVESSKSSSNEWSGSVNSYLGPHVISLRDRVDDGLKKALENVLVFLQGPQTSSRTDDLAPYLQERVFSCMSEITEEISKRVKKIAGSEERGEPEEAVERLCLVERGLFLGRLSLALSQNLSYLPSILGSPDRWSEAATPPPTPLARSNSWLQQDVKSKGNSKMLGSVQSKLKAECSRAYGVWISWSTQLLVESFIRDLSADECLSTTSVKGWEETDEGEDVKMELPTLASPYAVSLLFVANQEIYRVGGHIVDKTTLQMFSGKLIEKVVNAYDGFLSQHISHVSEKGVFQLMFDVRYLGDVVVGGIDATSSSSSSQTLKTKINNLLSLLQSTLDPIDWATYQSEVWEKEKRAYQRSAVLFGYMTQMKRVYSDHSKIQTSDTNNTLPTSPVVPRFTYLPTSMPVVNSKSGGKKKSFTSAGNSINSNNTTPLVVDTSIDNSNTTSLPLFKSLMGQMGNKLGEGTLKFGSIISDGGRLRDRSAAALSSTFGDILPTQAAGLLLSSFTSSSSSTKLES